MEAVPGTAVLAVLEPLEAALAAGRNAVLVAPPGSGKTTRVPLALCAAPWLAGQTILLLEPRRLAARAAARFMAAGLGEAVGERVGYRVRLEQRVSPRTRVEVVTEGILTRRLQQDPALEGVGLVIFDEFHERSLAADLGLALCLDVQRGLRPELRLLVMSATLEDRPLAALLGDAARIRADGRSHPVTVDHAPPPPDQPQALAVAGAVRRVLAQPGGDLLVFLPGVAEIRRAAAALAEQLSDPGVLICPLYGDLDAAAQDRAIRPDPGGCRRVVLATAIAETSLTIGGVDRVVDAGFSRVPRFDPNTGLTRLETRRVSRAAADQRCGRAGRLGPGRCLRLWPAELALMPQAPPEILQADLAPLVLELALWGVRDPAALSWLDPPPEAAFAQGRALLQELGALDRHGRITAPGRRLAALPLHPRLAHLLVQAAQRGARQRGADLAALLEERDILAGPGSRPCDLEPRLAALAAWRAGRATAADPRACQRVDRIARDLARQVTERPASGPVPSAGTLVALAYPDRVARSRSGPGYRLASGRGARLPPGDGLTGQDWLAVAALDAGRGDGRIFLAAALAPGEPEALFPERIEQLDTLAWDSGRRAVTARRERRLGALVLDHRVLPRPPAAALLPALLAGLRQEGSACLPWTTAARGVQARVLCLRDWQPQAGWPDLSDGALLADLEHWLGPWLDGVTGLDGLARLDLAALLRGTLDGSRRQRLETLAPERLAVPSGARRAVRYQPGEAPVLAVKLQELFGLRDTPRVCGGAVAVVLHLLSPAGRPLQITRDLAGFWDRTYAEVRREMKGRYPKHHWPEDPRQALPTARLRPR
jgi:ATP-dependent helicase HrpB